MDMMSKKVMVRGKKIEVESGRLDLRHQGIQSIGEIEGLDQLKALEELILDNNEITRVEGLDALANLWTLNLSHNQITRIEGLDALANLGSLNLSHNQITRVEGLDALVNLRELSLSHNPIKRVEGLDALANLMYLDIPNNQITRVEGLDALANLGSLNLSHNQITRVEGLDALSNLRDFSLSHNRISCVEGLNALANLGSLNLSHNQITQVGDIEGLKAHPRPKSLSVNLSGNPLEERYEFLNSEIVVKTLFAKARQKAKEEALQKAKEEARQKAKEEARQKAKEEARQKVEGYETRSGKQYIEESSLSSKSGEKKMDDEREEKDTPPVKWLNPYAIPILVASVPIVFINEFLGNLQLHLILSFIILGLSILGVYLAEARFLFYIGIIFGIADLLAILNFWIGIGIIGAFCAFMIWLNGPPEWV